MTEKNAYDSNLLQCYFPIRGIVDLINDYQYAWFFIVIEGERFYFFRDEDEHFWEKQSIEKLKCRYFFRAPRFNIDANVLYIGGFSNQFPIYPSKAPF